MTPPSTSTQASAAGGGEPELFTFTPVGVSPGSVATSIACASLTLAAFHEFTPGMVGASRGELFLRLPSGMQQHAYDELDERIRGRSARLFADIRNAP